VKGSTGTARFSQLLSGYGSWAQARVSNVLKSLRNSVFKEKLQSVEQMQLMQRYVLEFAGSLEQRSPGCLTQLKEARLAGSCALLQVFKATQEKIIKFLICLST